MGGPKFYREGPRMLNCFVQYSKIVKFLGGRERLGGTQSMKIPATGVGRGWDLGDLG